MMIRKEKYRVPLGPIGCLFLYFQHDVRSLLCGTDEALMDVSIEDICIKHTKNPTEVDRFTICWNKTKIIAWQDTLSTWNKNTQEKKESVQTSTMAAHYPHIAQINDLESLHGDPDHHQN